MSEVMSKRLQVLLPEREMADIQQIAESEQLSVGEWVRRALREARASRPAAAPATKLQAIRRAATHAFPTADIDQMLAEIEQSYMDKNYQAKA
jgi:hypothetical protein